MPLSPPPDPIEQPSPSFPLGPPSSVARAPLVPERLSAVAAGVGLGLTVVDEIDSTNAELARIARASTSPASPASFAGAGSRASSDSPESSPSSSPDADADAASESDADRRGGAAGAFVEPRPGVGGSARRDRGQVLVAERQTAGRGRLDRSWASRPGAGLTVSVLIRPLVPTARLGWLPMVVGTSLVATLREVAAVPAVLKWPNDILVGGEKLAGILVELVPTPFAPPAVVIGFGLNVAAERDELPERSTSLLLSGARPMALDRTELLAAILVELAGTIGRWEADPNHARSDYLKVCATIGRQVRVELPDGSSVLGTATDVEADGRLVVDGRPYSAADVVHLR